MLRSLLGFSGYSLSSAQRTVSGGLLLHDTEASIAIYEAVGEPAKADLRVGQGINAYAATGSFVSRCCPITIRVNHPDPNGNSYFSKVEPHHDVGDHDDGCSSGGGGGGGGSG